MRNIGQKHDEDIRVLIKIPQYVTIVLPSMFPEMEYFAYKFFSKNSRMLEYLLKIKEDYQVKIVTRTKITNTQIQPKINKLFGFNGPSEDDLKEDYYDNLSDIFNLKLFKEGDYQLIEYSIDYLKHNENIAFDSLILVKADKSFPIEYQITSKYNPEIIRQEIVYTIK